MYNGCTMIRNKFFFIFLIFRDDIMRTLLAFLVVQTYSQSLNEILSRSGESIGKFQIPKWPLLLNVKNDLFYSKSGVKNFDFFST